MTQDAAETPSSDTGSYRQQLHQWISEGIGLAKLILSRLPDAVLGPRQTTGVIPFSGVFYRGILAAGALFLLGVAVWFASGLRDYSPVTSEDLHIRVYTNEILNSSEILTPNPPMDRDGRREGSGRG